MCFVSFVVKSSFFTTKHTKYTNKKRFRLRVFSFRRRCRAERNKKKEVLFVCFVSFVVKSSFLAIKGKIYKVEKNNKPHFFANLTEDWWSVIIAFGLILLSVLGVLGKNGLPIFF